MICQIFLLVACTASVVYGDFLIDPREMAAVQDRLSKYETLEKVARSIFLPEEAREEEKKCIPEGAECNFWSGPNCCGIETRCFLLDTQLPATKKGGSATWLSKCRKYKFGVFMKKIQETFGK